jgi:hypothetical protein
MRLREFVANEYDRRGRHEEAIGLMWAAFSDSPGLTTYQRLHDHAALGGRGTHGGEERSRSCDRTPLLPTAGSRRGGGA